MADARRYGNRTGCDTAPATGAGARDLGEGE
jgi:hypothetical protein